MGTRVDVMIHIPHGTEGIVQDVVTLHRTVHNLKPTNWEFPGGPAVKNPAANAGDTGSILYPWFAKIPHTTEQLSPRTHEP